MGRSWLFNYKQLCLAFNFADKFQKFSRKIYLNFILNDKLQIIERQLIKFTYLI